MFTNLQTAYAELTRAQFELQQQAAEIDETRDVFHRVIESMSEALFLLDRTGQVIRTNPAAGALLACDAADLLGKPFAEVCGAANIPATPWQLLARAPSGTLPDLDFEVVTRTNRTVPVTLSCGLVRGKQGRILGVVAVARDMTERKRAEDEIKGLNDELQRRAAELTATNAELEAFSYSVSHDLRAPLRSIDGFGRALEEQFADKLDEEGLDYLRRVRSAANRMRHLIDDLLSLSRVSRGELQRQAVDLSAIVWTIAAELRETQPERDVSFAIADGLVCSGDPRLLRVALTNLLGNAWKFTAKEPTARIEFGAIDDQGQQTFFIRDDGAGFDMESAHNLFRPFYRMHGPAEFEGTGIGLATVQRIVHRHGGRVWAEGTVDQGATFYFTL